MQACVPHAIASLLCKSANKAPHKNNISLAASLASLSQPVGTLCTQTHGEFPLPLNDMK